MPAVTKLGRPFLKTGIKNSLALAQGVTVLPANSSTTELSKIWQQAAVHSILHSQYNNTQNNTIYDLAKLR